MSGNLESLRTEYTFGRSIPSVITKNHSRVISCDEIEFDYQNLSIKTNKATKIKNNNNNTNNNNNNGNGMEIDDEKLSAYDFIQKNKTKLTLQRSVSTNSNKSGLSYVFHPKNLTSKFKSPGSTVSNQCDIDPLDTLNNNMDELNQYNKESQLGNGTDAYVYEIIHKTSKSHYAMKLTKRKSGRYRTEINLLHQLKGSPYIVKYEYIIAFINRND